MTPHSHDLLSSRPLSPSERVRAADGAVDRRGEGLLHLRRQLRRLRLRRRRSLRLRSGFIGISCNIVHLSSGQHETIESPECCFPSLLLT